MKNKRILLFLSIGAINTFYLIPVSCMNNNKSENTLQGNALIRANSNVSIDWPSPISSPIIPPVMVNNDSAIPEIEIPAHMNTHVIRNLDTSWPSSLHELGGDSGLGSSSEFIQQGILRSFLIVNHINNNQDQAN